MIHCYDADIAKKYGMAEAVLIYNFAFWIGKNIANNKHFHDGRYWTYCSASALLDLFPEFNSLDKVGRVIKHLIDAGLLMRGNYNKNTFDRTAWYAFTDIGLELVVSKELLNNPFRNSAESNPRHCENNTKYNTNNTTDNDIPSVFVLPPTGDNTHTSPKGEGDGAAPEIGFPAESVGEEKVSEVSQAELEFDKFRKAYRGTKRGLATEFAYFKKSHKDWRQVLQKLTVAYEHQCALKDEARAKGCFVAQEKNLKTYIYNRGWEEELHFEPPQRKQEPSIVEKMRNIEDGYQKYREYEKQKEEQDAKEGWHSDF